MRIPLVSWFLGLQSQSQRNRAEDLAGYSMLHDGFLSKRGVVSVSDLFKVNGI